MCMVGATHDNTPSSCYLFVQATHTNPVRVPVTTMDAMLLSLIRNFLPNHRRPKQYRQKQSSPSFAVHTLKVSAPPPTFTAFVDGVRSSLMAPLALDSLLAISDALSHEYKEKLQVSDIAMLPSYQHRLPAGTEKGDYFTLDVGGSTLRIGLVRLAGTEPGEEPVQIHDIRSFPIDKGVRDLKGQDFFDWIADRLLDALAANGHTGASCGATLDVGLTWSFAIEQTSSCSGRLLPMGKGFNATQGVEEQELNALLKTSCATRNLAIETRAIINDGAAALLSQAYRDSSVRISLVLGTGTNAAVYLPTSALGPGKFSARASTWHAARPSHVLVNTEMSLFGGNIFPKTCWDQELNAMHPKPDLQPLEYLSAGRYLGEIVRLILVDGIRNHQLFQSRLPHRFDEPYSLSTHLLAIFESDTDPLLSRASAALQKSHPLRDNAKPTLADLEAIRTISIAVTTRASAYLACAMHAMWKLRTGAENLQLTDEQAKVAIACNGSIIEKFPNFKERMQRYLDQLVCGADGANGAIDSGVRPATVVLEVVGESSVEGAAVACACA